MNHQHKLLIVEDDKIMLTIFTRILQKYFDVYPCKSVEEFEDNINTKTVDLFIMDLSLGEEKNGIDLIRELREHNKYSKTPIFVVTAHAFHAEERAAYDAGATKFFRKPVENEVLIKSVKESLGCALA